MATREVFSEQELAGLRGFPEITRAELIRYFTLTTAEEGFLRNFLGQRNVLGASVQLCTLPWLGFVPDEVSAAPHAAVTRLADRLGASVTELPGYGERAQTRSEQLREILGYAGWRLIGPPEWKELDEFLFARAMEHDSPKLLFGLACEYLLPERVVRPGVVHLLEHVAIAQERAGRETWTLLVHLAAEPGRRAELDGLLVVDAALGRTPLAWLNVEPTTSSPAAVKAELAKLAYLRGLDAHTLDLSMLPAQRCRFLAALGRRLTAQALARRDPERRYPILLTLLSESVVDVLDEVVLLFDQALSGRESAARTLLTEELAERARSGEDRQALLDEILAIALDPDIADADVGGLVRTQIGMERLLAAWSARRERLPRDHEHLAMLNASMSYVRQFAPPVLGAVQFAGGPGTGELMAAIEVLCELYATGTRKVAPQTPTGFVPARWRGYLQTAADSGDVTGYRHYWEQCTLLSLRDGLRSGDVFVPGSRRYADPTSLLLTPEQWQPRRGEYCQLAGKPTDAADALRGGHGAELHTALADLDAQLATGKPGQVRLGPDGELIIPQLTAEDVPTEAEALRDELSAMLPRVPLASVLVEIDARTGFTDHLVHAGGKVDRAAELKRNLLYVIISEATNMDLVEMAASAGVSYDVLAWTAEWYFRPETLEAANAAMVGYHHRLPLASAFGTGTLASSDGQRFPVKGKSITARHLSRYFARGQGISAYTAVSDQHATLDTKVIAATAPEGHYVLDGILGNTDPPILEHATDTHGATLANFALFDLVGKQLSPRIRDLGKITLCRPGPRAEFDTRYPHAGPRLSRRLNDHLISSRWDDLLRVAASVRGGHATAALVVGELCSSKRQQSALAAVMKEYGSLRRTLYAVRYLSDESYRRRIGRQLNKGKNLHSLRRALAYAHEGALRRRHPGQQSEQMWCLTLATNAIICWMTEYHGLAVTALRNTGRRIDDEVLAHIWPSHHENVHFYGTHTVDTATELATLDANGYRPLRRSPHPQRFND